MKRRQKRQRASAGQSKLLQEPQPIGFLQWAQMPFLGMLAGLEQLHFKFMEIANYLKNFDFWTLVVLAALNLLLMTSAITAIERISINPAEAQYPSQPRGNIGNLTELSHFELMGDEEWHRSPSFWHPSFSPPG
jgi:hypothetical protein